MRTLPSRVSKPSAFSLLELLVVCSIIAVVVGFTVPAVNSLIRGSQLTQAGQLITDQMALARQMALSRNHPIEVRFYKFADAEVPGEKKGKASTGKYRAFQAFEILESGGALPINKIQRLPSTVVINDSKELSLLIGDATQTERVPTLVDPELPREVARNYVYKAFRFLGDGSTNLPMYTADADSLAGGAASTTDSADRNRQARWCVTLHPVDSLAGLQVSGNAQPKDASDKRINFFTLVIDPVNGAVRTFRPTAG